MTHHLERGSCPNAPYLNRDEMYQLVRSKDPSGVISKHTIIWHESSEATYTTSGMAWNGSGYECYFCHREFRQLSALNQHLGSGVRTQNLPISIHLV